jgi:serine/threonine-protein phosphatase 2A regulatory subunit A
MATTQGDGDDLYQVAILVDQLKHDDVQQRVNAFSNLERIASALGHERTRDELIPFIADSIEDEDVVISVIADKLGPLAAYLRGTDYLHVLIRPLELLVCGEESQIRDKALQSAEEIVARMNEEQIVRHFMPLIQKLAAKDWFTARSGAASLIALIFGRVTERARSELQGILGKLSSDDTAAVRKAVAKSLPSIVRVASPSVRMDMLELLKVLAKDEQDSIRIQIIPASAVFASVLNLEQKANNIVTTIVSLASDRAWRVRWSLCHHLKDIFGAMQDGGASSANATHTNNIVNTLANVFENLLNDPEPEVRAAGGMHISAVCEFIPKAVIISKIVPTLQRLAADNTDFVRAVIASEVSQLSPNLGKEDTVKLLLPLLLSLLRDEGSDVRLNVISNLDGINATIGVELLSQSLLPAVISLGQDPKWRVRLAVIELTPMIGKQLGAEIFTNNLVSICIGWLTDTVYSIRKAGALNIRKLNDIFGEEWTARQIIPKLEKMQGNTVHYHRMACLHAAQVMLDRSEVSLAGSGKTKVSSSSSVAVTSTSAANCSVYLCRLLVPIVLHLGRDQVANVRMTVAKIFAFSLSVLPATDPLRGEIINILKVLSSDSDRDVRFYATQAIAQK